MSPACRPPAPKSLEELQELVRARQSAVTEATTLKNQLAAAESTFLKRQLERRIARLTADIKAIEREVLRRIRADDRLAERYRILTSIPGFGQVVATTLIACLAELGSLTLKQVALLAGLAPIADDSGQRQGKRVIFGGRAAVRQVVYLAALTASRSNPDMASFFRRLIDSGKPAKTALIAVARKLVVLANTLIAQNRTWQPVAPKHS